MDLLQLLLRAQVVRVSAFLLATIRSARWQTSVTPVKAERSVRKFPATAESISYARTVVAFRSDILVSLDSMRTPKHEQTTYLRQIIFSQLYFDAN